MPSGRVNSQLMLILLFHHVTQLIRVPSLPGILQNDTPPGIIDQPPLFDFFDGAKAADADEIIVQAAISFAGGLNDVFDLTHESRCDARRVSSRLMQDDAGLGAPAMVAMIVAVIAVVP
jgi:hypothetical protein